MHVYPRSLPIKSPCNKSAVCRAFSRGPVEICKAAGYSFGPAQEEMLKGLAGANGGDSQKPRRSADDFAGLSEIYQGAISTVFHAVCNETGKEVVLKAYHKGRMDNRHIARLLREVQAQHSIQGPAAPHVCTLIDAFEDKDDYYLVLERCHGGDVFALQHENGGSLNEAYVCTEIVVPLLQTLVKLHESDWIHRDIKPENIFLTHLDEFKLGDFGLSINFVKDLPFHISGTLDYLAPEMLRNPNTELEEGLASHKQLEVENISPYGPSVDVWAVGVIAYELVTGTAPFSRKGDSEEDTMHRIMHWHDIDFPGSMSQQWAHFCRCALEKEPGRRPGAGLLLHHPWVRHHLAMRRRGVECSPVPLPSLLCQEERRRLQQVTVVDRTGMRHNSQPRDDWYDDGGGSTGKGKADHAASVRRESQALREGVEAQRVKTDARGSGAVTKHSFDAALASLAEDTFDKRVQQRKVVAMNERERAKSASRRKLQMAKLASMCRNMREKEEDQIQSMQEESQRILAWGHRRWKHNGVEIARTVNDLVSDNKETVSEAFTYC